jgi:hypothetical protein
VKKDGKSSRVSNKQIDANRRNSQLSTGPKTEVGKNHSRRNALKHGVLASALLITSGEGAEESAEFEELLDALDRDLAPVGRPEEMMVEKIAVCWWRQRRAIQCEAGLIQRSFFPDPSGDEELLQILRKTPNPKTISIKEHLKIPLGADLDRILRYETTIQRQLVYAMNQLERLQRIRKGEHIPAPVNVQLSNSE